MASKDAIAVTDPDDDDRWFTVNGRRWRKTDPALPAEIVSSLQSHLGRARAAVRTARAREDADGLAAARHRVGLAKTGLGERGEVWWERPESDRIAQGKKATAELEPEA